MGDGRWRAVLSLGVNPTTGKRRRLKLYAKTKQAVLARLRDAQARAAAGTLSDAGRMTLGDWLARWLASKRDTVDPGTWEQYRIHVECHLRARGGPLALARLRPLAVADLFADIASCGVSGAQRAKLMTTLRAALDGAVAAGLIPSNPAKAVPRPKGARPDIRVWDADQVLSFIDACSCHQFEALFRVALDTGARQGELFGLLGDCVDLDAGTVTFRRSLREVKGVKELKDTKTAYSRRTVRLSPEARQVLRLHLAGRSVGQGGPVFPAARGGFLSKPNLIQRQFLPLVEYAGLPRIRFHDLRHTCATMLLSRGCNIKAVSRRLGHGSVNVTLAIYAHLMPEMDDQILDALGSLYGGERP